MDFGHCLSLFLPKQLYMLGVTIFLLFYNKLTKPVESPRTQICFSSLFLSFILINVIFKQSDWSLI